MSTKAITNHTFIYVLANFNPSNNAFDLLPNTVIILRPPVGHFEFCRR